MVKCHCCDKMNVKRGLWTAEEDAKMLAYVSKHGTGNWTSVPKKAGLRRCGKSCRLRWTNYLRPDLRHESFTPQEEELIILLHATIGSRWSIIAQQLPGRTDNDVKNYWNTKLKKKLSDMGIDPVTHKPFSQVLADYGSINGGISKPGALRNTIFAQLPKPEPFLSASSGEFNPHITSSTGGAAAYYNNDSSLDLLSQLQAIKLVTEASNYQFLNDNSSSISTSSSSSSSTRSTAAFNENFDSSNLNSSSSLAFSWKDFLLEDELMPSNDCQGQEICDSQELEIMTQNRISSDHGGIEGTGKAVFDDSDFVDSMIDLENEMFSEFANLLEDPSYSYNNN